MPDERRWRRRIGALLLPGGAVAVSGGLLRIATAPTAGVLFWGLPRTIQVDGDSAAEMRAAVLNLNLAQATIRSSPLGCGAAPPEVQVAPFRIATVPVAVWGTRLPSGRSRLPVAISGQCGSRPIRYQASIDVTVTREP
jgi:hypothetical protein